MTPKEKALELVNKFDLETGLMSVEKKQCALIAVEEIQKAIETTNIKEKDYWYDVQFEINNL